MAEAADTIFIDASEPRDSECDNYEIVATRADKHIEYFATVKGDTGRILQAGRRPSKGVTMPSCFLDGDLTRYALAVRRVGANGARLGERHGFEDLSKEEISAVSAFMNGVVSELGQPKKSWSEFSQVSPQYMKRDLWNQGRHATALAASTIQEFKFHSDNYDKKRPGTTEEFSRYEQALNAQPGLEILG